MKKLALFIIGVCFIITITACVSSGSETVTEASAAVSTNDAAITTTNNDGGNNNEMNNVKNFKVEGTKILNPDGEEFLIKGTNVNGPGWVFERDTLQDVNLIADVWKFNTVRLCAAIGWEWAQNNNSDLDAIIKAFTEKNIVVILEVHDYTGIYPPEDDVGYRSENVKYVYPVKTLTEWWVDKAERFKNNPYVWFNIMNEPGSDNSQQSAETWARIHGEIIEAIRTAGAENIIVLDEHGWGQGSGYYGGKTSYDSAVIRMGPELNKKYSNLVYSLHVYDSWRDGQKRFDAYFKDAKDLNLCVILGEFGVGNDNLAQYSAVKAMYNSAIPNNIGRIYWAWDDSFPVTTTDKGAGWTIDRTDGEKPTNLTWFGDLIWRDARGELTAPVPDYSLNLPLLPNGDFEDGANGWQDWGGSSVQSDDIHSGSGAMTIAGGSTGGAGRSIELKPNTTYRFSAWGKCDKNSNPGGDVGVKYRDAVNPDVEQHFFVTFKTAEWTQKTVEFTTPAEFSGATLFIWKGDEKATLYLDDLELVEVTG